MDKIRFSDHAKKRFRERFNETIEEYDNNLCLALCKTYYNSNINNSIKNDTMFMTYIYEKHGYDEYLFSIFDTIIFVVKNETLVTVLPTESYAGQRLSIGNSGFRKKQMFRQQRQNVYRR